MITLNNPNNPTNPNPDNPNRDKNLVELLKIQLNAESKKLRSARVTLAAAIDDDDGVKRSGRQKVSLLSLLPSLTLLTLLSLVTTLTLLTTLTLQTLP
jgi:hypothetical protein